MLYAKNKESRLKAHKLSTANKTAHPDSYSDFDDKSEHENRPHWVTSELGRNRNNSKQYYPHDIEIIDTQQQIFTVKST